MSSAFPDRALRRLLADAEPLLSQTGAAGEVLGRYRLVREIGRGGMGVVYEALDLELSRRVALKVLSIPPGAGPEMRERFLREARAAARLNHPGIAAVYDADEQAIAMQLVDGPPLSLLRGADRRKLVGLVRDAARAVHHAHEHGIVHRDLKPHNVLVEGERAVVTDFGLAKDTAVDSTLSLSGHVLGTPGYMAPEQAQGRVRDVDARTDVYGLGATLYDLLAGRPPFTGTDVVAVLKKIVEQDPPPLRRGVPRDLELVVRRCLAKERERRYPTALELAEDLDRWLGGLPVLARPPSLRYRLSRFAARRRGFLLLGGAGAAAALLALFATLSERAQRRASSEALALSERVAGALAETELHARLGEVEQASERLEEAAAACRAFLRRHEVPQARFLLGKLLRASARDEEALAELDRALALDPALAEARLERGLLLAGRCAGRGAEGAGGEGEDRLRERALGDLAVAAEASTRLRATDALHGRAELARLRGDLPAARRMLQELSRVDPLDARVKVALSRVALAEGDGDAAWAHAMSALDLYRGFGPAYVARGLQPPGPARDGPAGEIERALRQHELAAAEGRVEGGDRSSEALVERASARLSLEDVEGALEDFSAALQADPSDALAHGSRGLVLARRAAELSSRGEREEALAAWEDAIADFTAAATLEPSLAGALNNRGVCRAERERLLEDLGRGAEAERERERAGADFDEAIARAPRFALARLNRAMQRRRAAEAELASGNGLVAEARVEEGLADVDGILDLRAGDAAALVERALLRELHARLRRERGETGGAEEEQCLALADLDAAVRAAPLDARARGLRGIHRARRGEDAAGAADLEEALRLAPDARLRARFEAELAQLRAAEAAGSRGDG